MTGVNLYSTTAANNVNANTGVNWDEGMSPASVNNSARQNMADTRAAFNDLIWFRYGKGDGPDTVTYASGTSLTVAGVDVTTAYHAGRRIKAVGSGTGTIYGTISSSAFSTNTTINVNWDSGSLSNESLTIYLSQIAATGCPLGYVTAPLLVSSSQQTLRAHGLGGSYGGGQTVAELSCDNTSGSNFYYLKCIADFDGTPSTVFSILSDGSITAGGASLLSSASTQTLRVHGQGDTYGGSASVMTISCDNGTAGSFEYLTCVADFNGTPATAMQILANGNLQNTNNSYGAISDERLKQDITLAGSQWDDIKAIGAKVSKFHLKADPGGQLQIGLIAQDLKEISPGLVDADEDGMMSVKYSVLYMKAVKALSEALARIEALEAKAAA